jgi:hypothetical protein
MARNKKPQLTGADYIIGVADNAAESGLPYAGLFGRMAMNAVTPAGNPPLLVEVIPQRELRDYEAAPVAILRGAYEAAKSRKDRESMDEIMTFGLALLAKWPDYLVTVGEHPTLERAHDDS